MRIRKLLGVVSQLAHFSKEPCRRLRNTLGRLLAAAVFLAVACGTTRAQYLGYVANTSDGTVSIFATETTNAAIGNNDRLLATVSLSSTAKPLRIATTPDGTYAFVSSPSDQSVYLISTANPASWSNTQSQPPFNVKVFDFELSGKTNIGYTPGGLVVTPNPNLSSATAFYVWVTDSSNCEVHVYDFDSTSSTPGTAQLDAATANPIRLTNSTSTASTTCPSTGLSLVPDVAQTADSSIVYASFNGLITTTGSTTGSLNEVIQLNVASWTTDSPTFSVLSSASFPGFLRLRTATVIDSSSTPVTYNLIVGNLSDNSGVGWLFDSNSGGSFSSGLDQFVSFSFGTTFTPDVVDLTLPPGVASGSPASPSTGSTFSVLAADSANNQILGFEIACSQGTCSAINTAVSTGSALFISESVSGSPSSVSFTPDPGSSFIYVTESSGSAPTQLLLGSPGGSNPEISAICVVGTDCKSSSGSPQLYNTTVTVGNSPTGVTFGPISLQSGVLTWFTAYSINGAPPFTPFPPAPASPQTTAPVFDFFAPQGTPIDEIRVRVLGMVSVLPALPTWTGTLMFTSNDTNYACSGTSSATCPSPNGEGVQTADFLLAPAPASTTGLLRTETGTPKPAQSGSSPNVQPGDVTTIIFQGCLNNVTTPNCTDAQTIEELPNAECELFVNGSMTPSTAIVGVTNLSATMSCNGATGDDINAIVNWGDGQTSNPNSLDAFAGGASFAPSTTAVMHTYPATASGLLTVSLINVMDTVGRYSITPNNSIPVTIQAALAIQATTPPSGTQNSPYPTAGQSVLTAVNGTAPFSWSVISGNLPPGLTLTSSGSTTGFTGTPTASGAFVFTVQVTDSGTPVQTAQSATLTINVNGPVGGVLSVKTTTLPTGTQNSPYSAAVLLNNAGILPDMWSISSGALPPGLVIGATNGQITGTPTSSGAFNFTVQVTDSSPTPQVASKALTINITPPVPPLSITTTTLAGGFTGQPYTATVSVTGGTTPYTWSVISGALPPGLSLSASSGAISGTPTTVGAFAFTVQVTDSSPNVQTATQGLSINITSGPVNPTITVGSSAPPVLPGQPATFKLDFAGNVADAGAIFTVVCQGLPQGSSCSSSPSPFALDTNGFGTLVLTIATTGAATTVAAVPSNSLHFERFFGSLLFLPGLVGLLISRVRKSDSNKKWARSKLFALLVGVLLTGASACNTAVTQTNLPCPSCTPSGTATVQVIATSQHPALQASVNVQLQVSGVGQ